MAVIIWIIFSVLLQNGIFIGPELSVLSLGKNPGKLDTKMTLSFFTEASIWICILEPNLSSMPKGNFDAH